ncbi:MAG: Mov34/MPN/PAD-1 family protein [Myxococcales bacterium]|nr:Mov34/MPN/PAD-1 family protein [Myxococcales bacterium]
MSFLEESWILVGEVSRGLWFGRMISHQRGEAHSVDFSWRRALVREERYGDVVGFFHTHPPGILRPSARDVRTMGAWATCLGKHLLCAIQSGDVVGGFVFDPNGDYVTARVTRLSRPEALIAAQPLEEQ